MGNKIIDYCTVVKQLETDFWSTPLPEQSAFNKAAKEKVLQGWQPLGEVKVSPPIIGGMFASGSSGTISQAFVKYE